MTDNEMAERIAQTETLVGHARDLRAKLQADPQRPRYHFLPPAAWMNDINGPIFWKGRYHIFYQANPDEAAWKYMQWGHASSTDLVHWVHHPIAFSPTPGGPDRDGCFSGGMVVRDGVPTAIYHGVPDGTCLAISGDDLLETWIKHPANPVIRVPQPGDPAYGRYRVYDPCAWRHGAYWYALTGSRDPELGDTAYLFRSTDMAQWEFLHPFYTGRHAWTHVDEDCACPDFFPFGDRHMLLFGSHLLGTQYYLGRYEDDRFHPEAHGRLSWPGLLNLGAISMRDGQNRRLFFTWLNESRPVEVQREAGWASVMSLPRVFSPAADGSLRQEPIPELTALRYNARTHAPVAVPADTEAPLDGIAGDCLELALTLQPGDARQFGVYVRCSPDSAERTAIVCDRARHILTVDTSRSSLDSTVRPAQLFVPENHQRPPQPSETPGAAAPAFTLDDGEPLRLRMFLDRSVLDVFANERLAISLRIYPTRPDSLGVRLFARGGSMRTDAIEAWDMAPANS